jgi:hypothetical protein
MNDLLQMLSASFISRPMASEESVDCADILSEDQASYLFNELFPGLCRRCIEDKAGGSDEYKELVCETINSLASFFAITLGIKNFKYGPDLAKCMQHIFKQQTQAKFYHEHFQKEMEGPVQVDLENQSPEFMKWLLGLKVGDEIDAHKFDTRYNMKMWSVSKIEHISYGEMEEKDPNFMLVVDTT